MRTQTNYNKVVDFDKKTKEVTVLDYIFEQGDWKGATGTKFEPISKEEYEERTSEENFIEYLIDSGIELPEEYKRTGFQGLYEAMRNSDEIKDFVFDTSYSELWSYLRKSCGLSKKEAYIFNCSGGGRCFDKNFKGNKNKQLSKLIREIES